MAVTTSWSVKLEQYSNNIDVTTRTLGARVAQSVEVGKMGHGEATIEIDNNDGAFTPFNDGTYSDLDIYGYALMIDVTVSAGGSSYERNVFSGIVSEFELRDDGRNSTVVVSAVDALTIAGRSEVGYANLDVDLYFAGDLVTAVALLLDGWQLADGTVLLEEVPLPLLGAGDIDTQNIRRENAGADSLYEFYGYQEYTVADILNSSILPAAPAVMYPSEIKFETVSGVETTRYRMMHHDSSLVPETSFRKDFVFAQNAAGTELPFSYIDRGYNMDAVVNYAQVTRNNPTQFGGAATVERQHESSESVERFGIRAVEYGTVAIRWDVETLQSGELQPGAQQVAERWANRYDTPRFLVRELGISAKQVESLAADAAAQQWADYLHCEGGLWNTAQVVYAPTGGAERTDNVVVASRVLQISPEDCNVTVYCLPMQDNMGFVLDDAKLGKLGGTLDAYDTASYTYDELFGYDGHPVEGNRLV